MDRKLRTFTHAQQFEITDRDGLGFGYTQQVDPAGQDVLAAGRLEPFFLFRYAGWVGQCVREILNVGHGMSLIGWVAHAVCEKAQTSLFSHTQKVKSLLSWTFG